jgi:acyl-coenzyme A thioesterase PaaI-like protein
MDVTELPFNRLIGVEPAAAGSGFLVSLPAGPQYANHLGTVHAVALLAVAEAGAGAFLARQAGVPAGLVPVVRRLEAKFRRPATGRVSARCVVPPDEVTRWLQELESRGRVSATTPVEVADEAGAVVLTAVVEWFIARAKSGAEPDGARDTGREAR